MSSDMTINEWFAAELKERMDEMNIRPYHLMSLCKIKEEHVQSCLSGTVLPSLFNLVLLSDRLECTVNSLLGYDEIEDVELYEKYSASSMFFTESQYALCLSDRVCRYLDEHCMTFADLGKSTEIDVDRLRRWFSKTRPYLPPTNKFLHICNALECTPSELLGY